MASTQIRGTQIQDGTVTGDDVQDGSLQLADLANIAASKLLGRTSASTGAPQEITLGSGLTMSGTTLSSSSLVISDNLKDYITNLGFENDASGWTTYIDAAGTSPVDGTGGGATDISITRTTSTPLRVSASGLITKPGTNNQGQGVSYDFSIDVADKGKVLSVSFDYIIASGTFTAGSSTTNSDITIWLYDVTNSRLIQPTEYKLYSNSSTNPFSYIGTFQTSPDSTSYRFIMHIGSTTTNAFTFKFDNVAIGPLLKTITSAVSDWQSYTPTSPNGSFGTLSNIDFKWRRVGDSVEIFGNFTSTSPTGSEAQISLPSGLTSDSSKVPVISGHAMPCGIATGYAAVTNVAYTLIEPSKTYFGIGRVYLTENAYTKLTASNFSSSGNIVTVNARIPIAGWGSNVELNSMDSNRPVHARYTGTVSATSSSAAPVQWETKDYDTHAAVTTGSSWKFTAPSAGYYSIKCSFAGGATAVYPSLYKNGTKNLVFGSETAAQEYVVGAADIYLNAGDYIDVRSDNSTTISALTYAFIAISKLDSATQIGANETVAASYYCSANQSSDTSTPVNFDTKIHDTHNAVTTGSGWKFTAPVAGKYEISGPLNASVNFYMRLYKNGSNYDGMITYVDGDGVGTMNSCLHLLAGDYIDIRAASSVTMIGGALTGTGCKIHIKRIGN